MPSCIIGLGLVGGAIKRYADTFLSEEWIGVNSSNFDMWASSNYKWGTVIWAAGTSSKAATKKVLYEDHIVSLTNTLLHFPAKTFVYVSSQAVYSDTSGTSSENSPIRIAGLSDYGRVKLIGEDIVKAYSTSWFCLRPNGFVGVGLKKNMVFDLLGNSSPRLFIHKESQIQYIHTDYFAEVIFRLLKSGGRNMTLNVAPVDTISPEEIIKEYLLPDISDENLPQVKAILNTTRLHDLGIQIPSNREAIQYWNKQLYTVRGTPSSS